MDREEQIAVFLTKNKLPTAPLHWMNDAAMRRYARIQGADKSYILMDSPQSEHPFEYALVDKILIANGLHAPRIYDADLPEGLILMEDLGDDTYAKILTENPAKERELYEDALNVLIHLRTVPLAELTQIAPYTEKQMQQDLVVFTDWFIPYVTGKPLPDEQKQRFVAIWQSLIVQAMKTKRGFILWDFHINNLMKMPQKGIKACGILDFQDARIGPYAYDVVALLEDARRPMNLDLRKELLAKYLTYVADKDTFMRAYHILGVKRHLRVLGYFVRLCQRDKKPAYLKHIPYVYSLFKSHLDEACLSELKQWVDTNLPAQLPQG